MKFSDKYYAKHFDMKRRRVKRESELYTTRGERRMNITKQGVNISCSLLKDRISLTVFLRNEKIYRRNNEASSN